MRFEQFSPESTQEILDEVRMGQSDLDKFINSPEANGIRAGFEAELCFPGLGDGSGEPDYDNPEMDLDLDRAPRDIDDVLDFYFDGDFNGRRTIERAREKMNEEYIEWRYDKLSDDWQEVMKETVKEHIEQSSEWDEELVMTDYMKDELGLDEDAIEAAFKAAQESRKFTSSKDLQAYTEKNEAFTNYIEARDHANEVLTDLVKTAIEEQNRYYENAYDIWVDDNEDYDEQDWLRSNGWRKMSLISGEYDLSWPHYTYPDSSGGNGGWSDAGGERVADSMKENLGVNVRVSAGYHSAARKPDVWIVEEDGSLEANNDDDLACEIVSPPYPLQECITQMQQFFKWAKDEGAYSNKTTGLHVGVSLPDVGGRVDFVKLALFLGDKYVLDQFKRASNTYCESALNKLERSTGNLSEEDTAKILNLMRTGLNNAAGQIINQTGFGKYTSINMKGEYIEFRSMGNNYMNQVDTVINNVKRYAYAMYIASKPELYADEYAKKLYQLLQDSISTSDTNIINLFSRYVSKHLTKGELKQILLRRQQIRDLRPYSKASQTGQSDATKETPPEQRAQSTSGGEFTGRWNILDTNGTVVYTFGGVGNVQGDANRAALRWLQTNGDPRQRYTVVPQMA